MKCNITFTYIKVRIKAQWIHLTSINVHVQNHINHIIYGVHKTYTSAIEDGMFSSTHFRSSSWGNQVYFNYYSFIGGCWAYKRKVSYHFIRFRTSIGLCFKTSHFYTLCELNKMVEIKWQKKKYKKKIRRDRLLSVASLLKNPVRFWNSPTRPIKYKDKYEYDTEGLYFVVRKARNMFWFLPKASFISCSASSSSLTSSTSGLKAYLRN